MKGTISYLLLLGLLAGCESRSATQTAQNTAVTPAPLADSAALTAAAPDTLPPSGAPSEARQAVLRGAALPADTSAALVPKAARIKLLRYPMPLPPGYTRNHRYVGTLGGQPVVLELTGEPGSQYVSGWERPYYEGSYYFAWGGQRYAVSSEGCGNDRPLQLVETRISNSYTDDPGDQPNVTGIWQAKERLGSVLTGTWTDKQTRRTAHFELHEDYAGAVQYEEVAIKIKAKHSC